MPTSFKNAVTWKFYLKGGNTKKMQERLVCQASIIAQWCYLKAISLRWQHKNKGNAKVASQKN